MNKKLSEYSDEELVRLFQNGDSTVGGFLLEKYKSLVRKKARVYFLEGGDQEDLLQEGMLGLFKAIREYDAAREASFFTFAEICINSSMLSAIEAAGRKKHKALNESVPFESVEDDQSGTTVGTAPDPETIFVEKEAADELLKSINEKLSPMERRVLELYLDGLDYRMIAKVMGRQEKSIDNALQRIRGKVRTQKK